MPSESYSSVHELTLNIVAAARGPHACPCCGCPTWTDPPVPWVDYRDFVVQCGACERPISVRVDRDIALTNQKVFKHQYGAKSKAVDSFLDGRGWRTFVIRCIAAALLPAFCGIVAYQLGATALSSWAAAVIVVIPSALWMPALLASMLIGGWIRARLLIGQLRRLRYRAGKHKGVVELTVGRWDQWHREQRLRDRDRREHPDAVLQELSHTLSDRELRRVRWLATNGDVSPDSLEDLLRYRRSWRSGVPASR